LSFACFAFVPGDNLAGQSPVLSDVETLCLCPQTDAPAAFPAARRPGRRVPAPRSRQPGVFDEAGQLPTEVGGVLCVQIDFVGAPVNAEPDRLVRRTAGEVVLQLDIEPLHYYPPSCG
jgi:hypothetical protein